MATSGRNYAHWNWTFYMQLVTQTAWQTIIDNETSGRFTASGSWGVSGLNGQRYGSDYRYADPVPASVLFDVAWFKANIPATTNYEVFAWYPASSSYNSSTPYVIVTTSGNQVVRVNQQINGGRWFSLGIFNLSAGDHNVVGVNRGQFPLLSVNPVIADAVKIVRR